MATPNQLALHCMVVPQKGQPKNSLRLLQMISGKILEINYCAGKTCRKGRIYRRDGQMAEMIPRQHTRGQTDEEEK